VGESWRNVASFVRGLNDDFILVLMVIGILYTTNRMNRVKEIKQRISKEFSTDDKRRETVTMLRLFACLSTLSYTLKGGGSRCRFCIARVVSLFLKVIVALLVDANVLESLYRTILVFSVEKQLMWAEMLAEALKNNGIPVILKKRMGMGMALSVGPMAEHCIIYVPFARLDDSVGDLRGAVSVGRIFFIIEGGFSRRYPKSVKYEHTEQR